MKYKKSLAFAVCLGLSLGLGSLNAYADPAENKLFNEAEENITVNFVKKAEAVSEAKSDNKSEAKEKKKVIKAVPVKRVSEKVQNSQEKQRKIIEDTYDNDLPSGFEFQEKQSAKKVKKDIENKESDLSKMKADYDKLLAKNKELEDKLVAEKENKQKEIDEAVEVSRAELMKENERLEQLLTVKAVEDVSGNEDTDLVLTEIDKAEISSQEADEAMSDPLVTDGFELNSFNQGSSEAQQSDDGPMVLECK